MTWEQTIELARRVAGNESGVQYVGLSYGQQPDGIGLGLSLNWIDPKTNTSLLNTNNWQRVLRTVKEISSIPGFVANKNGRNLFLKDHIVAMLTDWGNGLVGPLEKMAQDGADFEWDIAPLPNYSEALGRGWEVDMHILLLSNLSKHKDEAYKVISLITGSETQHITNRSGKLTVMKDAAEYQKSFGADLKSLQGKNIAAVFQVAPSKLHSNPSIYDSIAKSTFRDTVKQMFAEDIDINTALRKAQEEADKKIQQELQK
jgi:multiple sugar transport system substrate-binding protein